MEGKNRVVNSAEVEPTQEAKPVEVVKSPEEVKPTRPEVKPVESQPEVKPIQPELTQPEPEVNPVESQPESQPKSQPEPAKEKDATVDALPSSLLPQRSNCKRDREEDATEQPGKRQRALDTAKQAIKSGVTFMERNSSIFLSVLFLVTAWFASAN